MTKDYWDGYITEPVKPTLGKKECQHRWEEVPDRPIYKCVKCNAFMVMFK